MARYIDLTNQIFGNLKVISFSHTNKNHAFWNCKCLCGNDEIITRRADQIKKGTGSCGCLMKKKLQQSIKKANIAYKEQSRKALLNKTFGELTVLNFYEVNQHGGLMWECQCSCGQKTIASTSQLNSGRKKSCGCIKSHMEKEIVNLLQDYSIKFIQEYTFSGLKSNKGGALRFDFAILNKDKCIGLIEYHGIQHYDKSNRWYHVDKVENDHKKLQYCRNKQIPLLILNKDNYSDKIILDFINKMINSRSAGG